MEEALQNGNIDLPLGFKSRGGKMYRNGRKVTNGSGFVQIKGLLPRGMKASDGGLTPSR